MARGYGYIRVSKDPDKEKISPDIQRQLIRRYAKKERLELVEVYGDVDIPSAKINFAGTWQLMADRLDRGDLIITNDASRLGRDGHIRTPSEYNRSLGVTDTLSSQNSGNRKNAT